MLQMRPMTLTFKGVMKSSGNFRLSQAKASRRRVLTQRQVILQMLPMALNIRSVMPSFCIRRLLQARSSHR